ncbi:MAG: carbohydrate-binding protein [Sulfobacillus benefaciens]|uniref:Carbohydrate-binding protein n=1 Tax=Sulfobacillus benefaciens TaxID=453960 RepID=A0A2T2XIL1_9FIRM|nr:MAG: carbohydrate-binding protein [Sulfobacillus benefaciens]
MRLNTDQLRVQAREFALLSDLVPRHPQTRTFWPQFKRDVSSLHSFSIRLSHRRVPCSQPAEDWLLDHIAFIQTQSQEVLRQLPRHVFHQLPRMRLNGMPRVYAICQNYLHHADGHYDAQDFEQYLQAYQEVSVLTTLECWVLPSAMRVVIIRQLAENMREVRHRHEICNRVTDVLNSSPSRQRVQSALNQMVGRRPLSAAEVVHLVRHLNEWEPEMETVRDWLSAYVDNNHWDLEHMTSFEHEFDAHLQVICGDLVTSLHRVERQPWRSTFINISHVDQILREDPKGEYRLLDFASQDLLRGRVEKIARQLRLPETLIARTAVQIAGKFDEQAHPGGLSPRQTHFAYYLLDPEGIRQLSHALSDIRRPGMHPSWTIRRHALSAFWLGLGILFVGLMWASSYWVTYHIANTQWWAWIIIFAALSLPVSEWMVAVVQSAIVRGYPSRILLRYDFSTAVPEDACTMVVIPIIWSHLDEVDDVMSRLEVHYLANRQPNIYFAVLADFEDGTAETSLGDQELILYAKNHIERLNAEYGADRFLLFHRVRRYNPAESVFMGWERKRGKLVEFVELLSGSQNTSFTTVHGNQNTLPRIRYVFTVDHDTKLPIGVVARMAGTIHFPYNRPRLNASQTRVVEGFGVLQPRIAVSYDSAQGSHLAALWAGEPGIDPYVFAVSHPYQNLFGEATFVGKGIFDVEAFRKTVVERIPDNLVLSHDLLEGGFLRTGLTPDIEVVEDHPSSFYSYQRRADRWIRGDWQLLPWLGTQCKNRWGLSQRVDLSPLARWQIIDNLRRSLVAPSLFLVALLGLSVLPGHRDVWAGIVLLTIFLPMIQAIAGGLWSRSRLKQIGLAFEQSMVQLITLPFTAVGNIIAIVRTLYRLFVSRRNLLEWVPAKRTNRRGNHTFVYEREGYAAIALFAVWAWLATSPGDHIIGTVLPALWLLSGYMIERMSRPLTKPQALWVEAAKPQLELWAGQIWAFFDHYVTAHESWLPPDNVQFPMGEKIAHRTSPTNIGLYLASVVAARDLNLVDTPTMIQRIDSTLATLVTMEKWHGHLFNWYDTETAKPLEPRYVSTVDSGNFVAYLMLVRRALRERRHREHDCADQLRNLETQVWHLIANTDFKPLFSADEQLFAIGYNLSRHQRDTSLYDLLASESRQTSFLAIALGQIPASHWFVLGRAMTISNGRKTLLSWSGSMFEYLLPSLILPTYRQSVWDATYQGVVARQRRYAAMRGVPWGISESGYYQFDYQWNYQYKAFGVPGLGMNSGLDEDLVVAPYATIMALPYAGNQALQSLAQLETLGAKGDFGFYEAVDFTRRRLPQGSNYQVVKSFMAHHQAMSLLTLTNLLCQDAMVVRMQTDPYVRAANLLLQERVPDHPALMKLPTGTPPSLPQMEISPQGVSRRFTEPEPKPQVNIVSNGHLLSFCREDGSGQLAWEDLDITRWRNDPVVSAGGYAIYLRDVDTEAIWSASPYPCRTTTVIETIFHINHTSFQGSCLDISWNLNITIHPDMDAEIRRLVVTNNSGQLRHLEVTSFLELALANPAADRAHLAFSKLFIETAHNPKEHCLLAHRRSRQPGEPEIWAAHTIYLAGDPGPYEFETDRAQFIGRSHSLSTPQGIGQPLTGSSGSVIDPAFVMRKPLHLAPGESATIYLITAVAADRSTVTGILDQLREPAQVEQGFQLAWARSQIDLHYMALTADQAVESQIFASSLIYRSPLTRQKRDAIVRNQRGQTALWPYGISGDLPIAVVHITTLADLPFLGLVARLHRYLKLLGIASDLVILSETGKSSEETLQHLAGHLRSRGINTMDHVIAVDASQLSHDELILLRAVAHVWLKAGGPSLEAQLKAVPDQTMPRGTLLPLIRGNRPLHPPLAGVQGEFFNGWGAFVDQGRAYRISVQPNAVPPRPWSNILANPNFGCLVTELGTGYTWWKNSRECKLTPWSNDPVLDPPGECLYLQDLDTKTLWSATASPAGGDKTFSVTHGFGFTRIEQSQGDIVHEMEIKVPLHDPIKLVRLKIRNRSNHSKHIAVTYYAAWVIGVDQDQASPYIVTWWNQETQTLMARNTYQETFRDAVAFLHFSTPESRRVSSSWTGNRGEFIGLGGSLANPASLAQEQLSCTTGAFQSSCGALQHVVDIPAQGETTVLILLGCASSTAQVDELVKHFGNEPAYQNTSIQVTGYWQHMTSQVMVKTPDRAMDLLLNGWLLYQTVSSRLWGRTAFYQAGGAFGFRDQLQDALALLHAEPKIARDQILLSAAHQYREGDVQHWWHQDTRRGIRTRISDDLLWLPYTVLRYWEQTGDASIFHVNVPYLVSDPLSPEENDRYEETRVSEDEGSILDHCLRAIFHAAQFGRHGIPLIGAGDWNDGMNRIGIHGRGESVWLGWFFLDVLKRFVRFGTHVPGMLSNDVVGQFQTTIAALQNNLNTFAWDGEWFRRAYTDDGTWIGTRNEPEGQIDAIAQSWAVISQGTSHRRQLRAMQSFDRELVDNTLHLAKLLTPPFDNMQPHLGYIQAYPPGIRENGGQYTHGVIWSIVAWSMLGRGDKAFELFSLLNPILHTDSAAGVLLYQNEPYVMSADIYTAPNYQGRAGWSWYTGSASWMYQAGLESILGIKRRGIRLFIKPSVPWQWDHFMIDYHFGTSTYHIQVKLHQGDTACQWSVDGHSPETIPYLTLMDDGHAHTAICHVYSPAQVLV